METAVRGDSESDSLLFPSLIVCLFQSCSSYCDLQESQNILFFLRFLFFFLPFSHSQKWVHAAWWLISGNVLATGVLCTCGTVGNKVGLVWINYQFVLCAERSWQFLKYFFLQLKLPSQENLNLCVRVVAFQQMIKLHLESATEAFFLFS